MTATSHATRVPSARATPDDAAVLDEQSADGDAFLDARAEPTRRRREREHRGHRFGLAVDRAVHAAEAGGREPGRQTLKRAIADELERDTIRALLADPGRRRAPRDVVDGDTEAAITAIPRLSLELAIELGPAAKAFEGQRALRGIASHGPHPRRARSRRRCADAGALEDRHGHGGIGAPQVKRRAQAHEPAPDDHHRHGGEPSTGGGVGGPPVRHRRGHPLGSGARRRAMELAGQAAIVTGAGRGIGRATALELARMGADIVIAELDQTGAEKTAAEVQALGRKALVLRTDVTKRADLKAMASAPSSSSAASTS
jgi:hypothetical protein